VLCNHAALRFPQFIHHFLNLMDATDSIAPQTEQTTLSYDDTVAYEEQLPTEAERAAEAARSASLANRVGNSRVYLLSESSTAATRATKVV